MQVNLAAQVLSHSFAAGISALVTLKHQPVYLDGSCAFSHYLGCGSI